MAELEFYTNDELINELLSRSTFAGIIILPDSPMEEVEYAPWVTFNTFWNDRLPEETVRKVLLKVIEELRNGYDKGFVEE